MVPAHTGVESPLITDGVAGIFLRMERLRAALVPQAFDALTVMVPLALKLVS